MLRGVDLTDGSHEITYRKSKGRRGHVMIASATTPYTRHSFERRRLGEVFEADSYVE